MSQHHATRPEPVGLAEPNQRGTRTPLPAQVASLTDTAVLPQFIDRGAGHPTLQLATLGVICLLIALLSDSTWAIASGAAREWLGRSPKRLERLSLGGGVAMMLLGAWLAVTGRRR
jgi:threonine/homoserine/homoserine lactone efflux protein